MAYQFTDNSSCKSLLHTPEGLRDIYNGECERKRRLENAIHDIFRLYGFRDIQTPMFEFFDIFNKERGTIASREMYKFFDRDGNTLVLRPDITPSIARCAAKYYREEELPVRLCYMGNTFINHVSYQGKLRETTQLGAELINDDTSDADGEMVALTIECLLKAGLLDFQVEIGHAQFLSGILEEAFFQQEETEQLKSLIESKNMFGIEDLISQKNTRRELRELILKLPELFGSVENLTYARERTQNPKALKALDRMQKLYHILEEYGLSKYVTFDLGMLSKYDYYTGIIFKAYTYGNGEPVVKGGRYDNLLRQFGKEAKAIGLAITSDLLMAALARQKITGAEKDSATLMLYKSQVRKTAIDLALQFREQGMEVELIRRSSQWSLEEYKEYAKRRKAGGILSLEDEDTVLVIHLDNNTVNKVKLSDMKI